MRIERHRDRSAMGAAAGAAMAGAIRAAQTRGAGPARVVFAAAPSQAEALDALAAAPGIDWSRVEAFQMDDYIGLPPDAPQLFWNWLDRALLARVRPGAAHRLDPGRNPEAAAGAYAAQLAAAPLDLVCLGIGVNGHLAFNDPPVADFADPLDVKVVELDAVCRQQQVDDGGFPTLADVPARALTLTIPRLLRADRLVVTVPGAAKRPAVRAALHGPLSTECPASILRTCAHATLFLDAESDPDA